MRKGYLILIVAAIILLVSGAIVLIFMKRSAAPSSNIPQNNLSEIDNTISDNPALSLSCPLQMGCSEVEQLPDRVDENGKSVYELGFSNIPEETGVRAVYPGVVFGIREADESNQAMIVAVNMEDNLMVVYTFSGPIGVFQGDTLAVGDTIAGIIPDDKFDVDLKIGAIEQLTGQYRQYSFE